jgi:hypothetical protein
MHLGIFFLSLFVAFHLILALIVGVYYFYALDMGAFNSIGISTRFILDFILSYLSVSLVFGLPLSALFAFLLRKYFSGNRYIVGFSRFLILFVSLSLLAAALLLANSERIGSEIRLIPFFGGGILLSFLLAGIWAIFSSRGERRGWRRWAITGPFLICILATAGILGSKFSAPAEKHPVDLGAVQTASTGIKILILGIDGADWIVLDRFMQEGVLPNLQKVREGGSRGELNIGIWYTAPSWTTLFSGVDHTIHGIVDYIGYSDETGNLIRKSRLDDFFIRILQGVPLEKIPESVMSRLITRPLRLCRSFYSTRFYPFETDQKPLDATHIKEKRIWQVASEMGRRVGLFSADLSWPAEAVNGYMVTNAFMRGEQRLSVYPESLYSEVKPYLDGPVVFPATMPEKDQAGLEDRLFLGGIREQYERQFREISIVRHLWKKEGDFDLLIYKFRQPDSIKHRFLQFMRPEVFPWSGIYIKTRFMLPAKWQKRTYRWGLNRY